MTSQPESPFGQVQAPCRVVVLTAHGCPHCRAAVAEMQRLSMACAGVDVEVLELADTPSLASRFGVRSVPAVIVDNDLCLEGKVTAEELAALLAARGAPEFEARRCRALLEHGRVADASARLGNDEGGQAIAALLGAPELSMRMGAQLAVREAFERSPEAVARVIPKLVELTTSGDPAVRGDVADLLGTVGDASVHGALQALASGDDDEDVREAAHDALEQLAKRGVGCC